MVITFLIIVDLGQMQAPSFGNLNLAETREAPVTLSYIDMAN